MPAQPEIRNTLAQLQKIATSGFALALHVRFTTPTFLFQTYAKEWLDYYSQNGLVMSDPTVAWGFENTGTVDWADLKDKDVAGVLKAAEKFGISNGLTIAVETDGSRSLCSFARAQSAFTAEETALLVAAVENIHALTTNQTELPPETRSALRTMSVQYTHSG